MKDLREVPVPYNSPVQVKTSFGARLKKDLAKNSQLYLLIIPVIAFYILFHYGPMYGALIAFQNYDAIRGIWGSPWIGFHNFTTFFSSYYFWRLIKNTLVISLTSIAFGFPAPIILALLINELTSRWLSKTVQTVTYMPHFISTVVICSMIVEFTKDSGLITYLLSFFGFPKQTMLNNPTCFVPIYVTSGIWKNVGWGSIIYLAALAGIDPQLYEAAEIDGAGRWKQMLYVTLPGLFPTIIILLILRVGGIMSVGYEKIILLYNPATYSTADVISSFVYRKGLIEGDFGYSTAVGIFNSIVNFIIVIVTNKISKKTSEVSLW